jgi:hypothetical protein
MFQTIAVGKRNLNMHFMFIFLPFSGQLSKSDAMDTFPNFYIHHLPWPPDHTGDLDYSCFTIICAFFPFACMDNQKYTVFT